MENAIAGLAAAIPVTVIDAAMVTSMALGLPNGIVAASGGRHEGQVVNPSGFKGPL